MNKYQSVLDEDRISNSACQAVLEPEAKGHSVIQHLLKFCTLCPGYGATLLVLTLARVRVVCLGG